MVKSTGSIREVDQLGRVVLPIEVRRLMGIEQRDGLEIFVDEDSRRIILEKASKMCMKCQSTENLKEIKPGLYLCDGCIHGLKY